MNDAPLTADLPVMYNPVVNVTAGGGKTGLRDAASAAGAASYLLERPEQNRRAADRAARRMET